jgi:catechol 2,3-dioxygenase-like lactoylglutathione lyase family enzyme
MRENPIIGLSGVVLDAPDAPALAAFYRGLLGWEYGNQEEHWVTLKNPRGTGLSFQSEPNHVPPQWPSTTDRQQMQLHLDIEVENLDTAGELAVSLGARLAEFQPQQLVRVYLDPAGHPFCLWVMP